MKISGYQMFWLICISSIIILSYLPIRLAIGEARQDGWISILLGGTIMIAITWIMLRICMQNENRTLVGMLKSILGSFLGKIVVLAYFANWMYQMSMLSRGVAEFQNIVLLRNTPSIVIIVCLMLLVYYAIYKGGLSTICRCAEFIGPLFVLILFVQLFLNPQDMNVHRIMPVYADSGWLGIVKGTLYSMNYMMDPSIVLMLFYFANNKRTAVRAIMIGSAVSVFWGVLTTLILLFVNGPDLAANLTTPVYSLTKIVSILNFIQNIDAFYIAFWLLGVFIKFAVCLFILSYGLSEWTGYRNLKVLALLITVFWLALSIYVMNDLRLSFELKSWYQFGLFYPFVYVVVPLLLWMIGSIKKRGKPVVTN